MERPWLKRRNSLPCASDESNVRSVALSSAGTFSVSASIATTPGPGPFGAVLANEIVLHLNVRLALVVVDIPTMPRIVPAIRVGDLTKVFALPKRTLQRALQELTKKGLLIKNGTGKSTWYETTK